MTRGSEIEPADREIEKARGTNLEPRAFDIIENYRFLEPSLRSRATVGVSSAN